MSETKEKANVPIVARKTIHKVGGSIMLPLPLEWFRAHGFGKTPKEILERLKDTDLLVLGNCDIRVVNPSHRKKVEKEVYDVVSDKVSDANITEKISDDDSEEE